MNYSTGSYYKKIMKVTVLALLTVILCEHAGDSCFTGLHHTHCWGRRCEAGGAAGMTNVTRVCVNQQQKCRTEADCDACVIDPIPCLQGGGVLREFRQ